MAFGIAQSGRNNFTWLFPPWCYLIPGIFLFKFFLSHPAPFFLGFASFRLYNSSSAFAVVFFPGKIQVSRLGFVLFPLSRCSRTIPILPSSSSSRMRSWWGCNVASDPGSWNSKPTHPTLGSGAGPEQDLTWSQFHLENPGNFLPEEGR